LIQYQTLFNEKLKVCEQTLNVRQLIIFQKVSSTRAVLIGAVSAGIGCGSINFPGIYTNVAEYLSWINLVARDED